MISINNLSYFIGDRALYDEASLFISPKDRIGLIGLNGTGKSTLLKMLDGDMQPNSGEINKSKETTIGFLNQDLLSYQSDDSILEVAMQAFGETLKLQHQIDEILKKMETHYEDSLIDKLAKLQERFETNDGYALQARAEAILEGIGFTTKDLKRPLREFSGGWRMRVMLAKLLLEKPSLLMLDEPTNHLDLPSIQWIENYLQSYEGAIIVVSHDRTFLNNTVSKIVEVYSSQLHSYTGNYDKYESEKELRNEIQQSAFENQQQKIKQAERFVERFKAKASKAKQAQSRMKALDKMDRIEAVVDDNQQVNFKFNFKIKSGRHVKTIHDISKSYGDLDILKHAEGLIERGDKIALVGANGKGKSTLLRIIAGTERHTGKVETGHNVISAFYAQHQLESLGVNNEILEELKQAGSGKTDMELRGILGCFLFSDDEVFKKIKVLSGGEKSRVALAKTLISEANFLLLDEPTNHLDILSVSILEQALQQYEGTFLVVSHDRDFVSKTANKIWWIEDNKLKVYPGTYVEWDRWYKREQEKKLGQQSINTAPAKEKKDNPKPKTQEPDKELKKQIELAELTIEKLEEEIASYEQKLADPDNFSDPQKMDKLNNKYQSKKSELEKANTKWEELVEKMG
ncbi:MAG: ATP-binding cassette subfamily F protein 3 [Cyclobacteriaceae bacterium]|jgi:ATP-binding cassette subfamily F protein 3